MFRPPPQNLLFILFIKKSSCLPLPDIPVNIRPACPVHRQPNIAFIPAVLFSPVTLCGNSSPFIGIAVNRPSVYHSFFYLGKIHSPRLSAFKRKIPVLHASASSPASMNTFRLFAVNQPKCRAVLPYPLLLNLRLHIWD